MENNLTSSDSFSTEPPIWLLNIFGSIVFLASILGTAGNGILLFVFLKRRTFSQNQTYRILFYITTVDFLISFCANPFSMYSLFKNMWSFGEKGCTFYGFFMTFLGLMSITLQTFLAVDRFGAIVVNLGTSTDLQNGYISTGVLMSGFIFVLSWSCFPFLGWSSYVYDVGEMHCAVNWQGSSLSDVSFCISLLIVFFVTPLFVMTTLYMKILKTSKATLAVGIPDADVTRRRKVEERLTTTVFMMIGVFIASWSPYALVSGLIILTDMRKIPSGVKVVPAIISKLTPVWNPLILTSRNHALQNAIRQEVSFLSRCSNRVTDYPDTQETL